MFGIGEHHTRAFAVSSPRSYTPRSLGHQPHHAHHDGNGVERPGPGPGVQDFATLDLVSHGRAEIIAGRSALAEPFALFGEDIAG